MTRRTFPNPFGGKPAPIRLTSYFLLSPEVFLKLSGIPVSAIWRELGKESVIKSLEYHHRLRQRIPPRLRNELLAIIPIGSEMRDAFQSAFDAADSGDDTELHQLNARGHVATFLDGFHKGKPVAEYSYANRYILALEDAFVEPARLIDQGEFAEATRVLARSEIAAPLLSPEMAFALAAVTSKRRLGLAQWAIALETALSHLAAWSASLAGEDATESVGDITPLFAGETGLHSAPGPLFFRFLMHAAKQESMMALADRLADDREPLRVDVNVETLKRWSVGRTLPERGMIKLIAKKCCPDQEERLLNLHWAMRYLTLLGYVSETLLIGMARHSDIAGASALFAPWPTFPFGWDTFQTWCQKRYPFWYRYHHGQFEAGTMGPAAS